jgi:sigma-54 dependent transcriptional regulator, acetoin dehydrogenase operon transcriptional activator AcoR
MRSKFSKRVPLFQTQADVKQFETLVKKLDEPSKWASNIGFMQPIVSSSADGSARRLAHIQQARQAVMLEGRSQIGFEIEPWIERSWQRCLERGQDPSGRASFDPVSAQTLHHLHDANQALIHAAKPVLNALGSTLAATRYFAILTNHEGIAVAVDGPIDRHDARARDIARVGVDLSEYAVGTTAIGAALGERAPVWLHRGEHFFEGNSVYSCSGAPIFGPDGHLAGMLDFTGVDAPERRELLSLAVHSSHQIQAAMLLALPHALLLQLSWPSDGGQSPAVAPGLLAVNSDGVVIGADTQARNMLGQGRLPLHAHLDDLFAMPSALLWDSAKPGMAAVTAPLWSGLRLSVQAQRSDAARSAGMATPLRALENNVIRQAVDSARGNVAAAAKALGISRATVYRKLKSRRDH